MTSPYDGLPSQAFWRTGVAEPAPDLAGIYEKRFDLTAGDKIATAGSCFAQHIARPLRRNGFDVLDAEPAPADLPPAMHQAFGYGLYSARHGNIYTVAQLLQLAREAFADIQLPPIAWERCGRWFDAFRPGVEPDGLPSEDDVALQRSLHLARVRSVLLDMDVFVFTLGLTEHWGLKGGGPVFPMAPGTVAGAYDPDLHEFRNAGVFGVVADFVAFDELLARHRRPDRPLRYILTVSPVPLTATASGAHVLAATAYSKAVLRAAAGELFRTMPNVDYFPAYEIVTNPGARATHFASNLRTVRSAAVAAVMDVFLAEHRPVPVEGSALPDDVAACEEAILDAFGAASEERLA